MTSEYDLVLITTSDEKRSKDALESAKKLIEKAKGKVVKEASWGRKILAYKINKQSEGIYYILNVRLESAEVKGVNDKLKNTGDVIRYLLLRKETVKIKKAAGREKAKKTAVASKSARVKKG